MIVAEAKSESGHSETEGPEVVAEAKETEELLPETGSNGDSEPNQENIEDGSTFSYDQLKTKSSKPVSGIDFKRREVSIYLHIVVLCMYSCSLRFIFFKGVWKYIYQIFRYEKL